MQANFFLARFKVLRFIIFSVSPFPPSSLSSAWRSLRVSPSSLESSDAGPHSGYGPLAPDLLPPPAGQPFLPLTEGHGATLLESGHRVTGVEVPVTGGAGSSLAVAVQGVRARMRERINLTHLQANTS